jgi:hypothetical protein
MWISTHKKFPVLVTSAMRDASAREQSTKHVAPHTPPYPRVDPQALFAQVLGSPLGTSPKFLVTLETALVGLNL